MLARYPGLALINHWEGTVLLSAVVDSGCRLSAIEVKKTSGHEVLDTAALRAVSNVTFCVNDIGTNTFSLTFSIVDRNNPDEARRANDPR